MYRRQLFDEKEEKEKEEGKGTAKKCKWRDFSDVGVANLDMNGNLLFVSTSLSHFQLFTRKFYQAVALTDMFMRSLRSDYMSDVN
jgi:hypothetical protein